MALNRYILTADVTVAAGTAATVVAGEPGTAGAAGFGSAATTGGPVWATTWLKGTVILLDPAGAMYTQIGAGNLRAYVQGSDDVGHGSGWRTRRWTAGGRWARSSARLSAPASAWPSGTSGSPGARTPARPPASPPARRAPGDDPGLPGIEELTSAEPPIRPPGWLAA